MKRDPEHAGTASFCAEEGYGVSITGEYRKKTVTDRVVELVRERERVGYLTYNKPMFSSAKTCLEWMDEAIAEKLDEIQYFVAARAELERIIKDG